MQISERLEKLAKRAGNYRNTRLSPSIPNNELFLAMLKRAGGPIPECWLPWGGPLWDEYGWFDVQADYVPYVKINRNDVTVYLSRAGRDLLSESKAITITEDLIFKWVVHMSLATLVWPILPENNLQLLEFADLIRPEKKHTNFIELYTYTYETPAVKGALSNKATFGRASQLLFAEYIAQQAFQYNRWLNLSPKGWTKFFGYPKNFDDKAFFYAVY